MIKQSRKLIRFALEFTLRNPKHVHEDTIQKSAEFCDVVLHFLFKKNCMCAYQGKTKLNY